MDKENVLYTHFGANLYGFALADPDDPSAGIAVRYVLEDILTAVEGPIFPAGTRLFGLSMTYDGHLAVTFSNGAAVIDRDLDLSSVHFHRFADYEYVSNSIAVDEAGGIYIASAGVVPEVGGILRKLVWTGSGISDSPDDGAWQCAYAGSAVRPPMIKMGYGTGSTPTLMGFGENEDRLVVIPTVLNG